MLRLTMTGVDIDLAVLQPNGTPEVGSDDGGALTRRRRIACPSLRSGLPRRCSQLSGLSVSVKVALPVLTVRAGAKAVRMVSGHAVNLRSETL